MSLTLVLGGTRSGKSAHAEALALATTLPVRYVATADPEDRSMSDRIAGHVARRPTGWETLVAGADLAATVLIGGVTLIDGLGVWIAGQDCRAVYAAIDRLIVASRQAEVIVVAEQAGEGMLPLERGAREWLDTLGAATQRLSSEASQVDYVVAGRPLRLPAAIGSPQPAALADSALRHHGDRDVRPGDADHAVNVLAGQPPAWLREALVAALDADAHRYPDESRAAAALAALHGCEPDNVVITNGAADALWLLGPALRPRRVALIQPGFTETEAALRVHGVELERIFEPSLPSSAADVVVITNPSSPDGRLRGREEVLALAGRGRVLVVDEAFMSLVAGEPASLAHALNDGVLVVRSLTKLLSVPGLRVGYVLAPAPLAAAFRAVRPPWAANTLALAALQAAAAHPDELAELAARAGAERADLQQRLARLPVTVWPSATNFVLIEVPDGLRLIETLRAQQIAVRPAGTFPGFGANHIRLTARDPESNERLVSAIGAAL